MTNLTAFDQSTALSIFQSTEPFPIDFENAWAWLGYSTKASAKRKLSRFKEGVDFSTDVLKNGERGRSSELITISIDCFKYLAMMAETELGDAVRMYFLECERIAKAVSIKPQSQLPPTINSKIAELTTQQATIRQEITNIENSLAAKRRELQEVTAALTAEAKAFQLDYPELFKQALLCQQILNRAKQDNPYPTVKVLPPSNTFTNTKSVR